MSTFTVIVTLLLLVPIIPLVLYAIGLSLPSEHTVTRSMKYKTTADILWAIVTSIHDYPAWRSNISQVYEDEENEYDIYEEHNRTSFVEFSTKKDRQTSVIHIEQEPERKLLRILEEKTTLEDATPIFVGSWSLLIEPVEGERAVILKITEQGVIKKPMVRVSHKLFFGYHRRIDRFMKDLDKEIQLGILEPKENVEQQEPQQIEEEEVNSSDHEVGPDESMMENKGFVDKDWDIISEIYDKK
jgi:hypothetical protein